MHCDFFFLKCACNLTYRNLSSCLLIVMTNSFLMLFLGVATFRGEGVGGSLLSEVYSRWSGDVMKRPGQKILMPYPTTTCGPRCCFPINVTDHFPCLPNFLLLNAKSKSWSRTDEICPRDRYVKLKNNTSGCERLWDTVLKFLCPGLFITSPDHLAVIDWLKWSVLNVV